MESGFKRMKNETLRDRLADALDDYGDNPWLLADVALAALGLDDMDAAIDRGALAMRQAWADHASSRFWTRHVLKAALTATKGAGDGDQG